LEDFPKKPMLYVKTIKFISLLFVVAALTSCKGGGDNAEITIPPGDLMNFSASEFLKYADTNFEIKLRKATSNLTLQDVADLTPSPAALTAITAESSANLHYLIPKGSSVSGILVLDIVSKSNGLNWKAIVLDPTEIIKPTVESTLLYDLISNYSSKEIGTYSRDDLKIIRDYIEKFSAERQELFGVRGTAKPVEIYSLAKNGLSSNLEFLNLIKGMGLSFNFDNQGAILSLPYPFGRKNNAPLIEDSRTTPNGVVGAYETNRTDIQLDARDPDGDRLFFYFQYLEDGSILKDKKKWSWTPGYSDSRAAPYLLRAFISDGSMVPIQLDWSIQVEDNNRPPKITGTCPTEVVEGTTWICDLTAADPDGDDLTRFMILNPPFQNAWPIINGTTYVKDAQISTSKIHMEWTPVNRDFIKGNPLTTLQMVVSDYTSTGTKKNGDDVKIIYITMKGKNTVPYPVTGPANLFNWNTPLTDVPRVLDTTFDPGGPYDADTRTANKKFYFEIVIADVDNVDGKDPLQFDKISLRIDSGADGIFPDPDAMTNMTTTVRNIGGVNRPVTVFRYWWQPTKIKPTVLASFTPIDDMTNGEGANFSITLTSDNRSELPSCVTSPTADLVLTTTGSTTNMSVSCQNRPLPSIATMTISNMNSALLALPQMVTFSGSSLKAIKRQVGTTDYSLTEGNFGKILNYNFQFLSQAAGAVRFVRSGLCDSANVPTTTITIPQYTQFRTSYVASPYSPRITYQTAVPVTLTTNDCGALVPVTAVLRTVAINSLSKIDPLTAPLLADGLTVKNTATVNYETQSIISVTFTRTATGGALTIPAQTTIRSDEGAGAESVVYVLPTPITMTAGQATVTAQVSRDFSAPVGGAITNSLTYYDDTTKLLTSRISSNAPLTWIGAPIAGVTLTAPIGIMPRSGFSVEAYKNLPLQTSFSVIYTYIDGIMPLTNEINLMVPPGLEPGTESAGVLTARALSGFSDLKVRNSAWTDPQYGNIEIYRTVAGPAITIPAGLVVSTPDRKLYQTIGSGAIDVSNSLVLSAQRIYEATYRPTSFTRKISFSDSNSNISYVGFPSATNINSGVTTAFKIEATDNSSSPLDPKDPYDRYYAQEYRDVLGSPLNPSEIQMCREQSGACTSCVRNPPTPPPATDPYTVLNLGTLSHEASRICYFRVTPSVSEVAQTYRYRITVCDYGQPESCVGQGLQFYVLETNSNPYFTAAHNYGTNTPGAALGSTTASALGGPTAAFSTITTPFNEGQTTSIPIYAYDNDKDAGNKTLSFSVLPNVYDLKSGSYKTKPTGLGVSGINNTFVPTGTGSLARANLVWTPTDDDAKKFSSSEGIIIGVKIWDNNSNLPISLSQTIYYKITLVNFNNTPAIGSIGAAGNNNTYTVLADTYFTQSFTVSDADWATPVSFPAFQTMVSACWNSDGTRRANSYFDAAITSPDICHLTGPEWTSSSFDPNYADNTAAAQCRSGANLNIDLAAPKITRTGGPTIASGKINYTFKVEWCPQKLHIGSYVLPIQVNDNGDMSVSGVLSASKGGLAPLSIKVISPIFLQSPKMNAANTITLKSIRQTAADLTAYPFTYQVISKNSRGNPTTYSIISSPRACGGTNGVCINASTGLVTWIPARADITDGNSTTNKKIVVEARDTVTNEYARGTIDLWIQDSLPYPGEQGVAITTTVPAAGANPSTKELISYPFNIKASDPNIDSPVNSDQLFIRIYVDGKITDDAEMTRIGSTNEWQATYYYKPLPGDADIDTDGPGPLLRGQHVLRAEVTDGNFIDVRQWTVNVRNSVPQPSLVFDLIKERKAVEPTITFANFSLTSEVGAEATISGDLYESMYLSGSYTRNAVTKYFLWSFDIKNDVVFKSGSGGKWNYNENLNWGAPTRHISYKRNAVTQTNDIFLTNQTGKYGTFTSTANSLQMNQDLTRYSNPLPTSLACNGCAPKHFLNTGYGSFLVSVASSNRNFYSGGNTLYWDIGNSPANTVPGWPAGYTVAGMAINPTTKRLFVSGSKGTQTENVVLVYDITPTLAATPANPILKSIIDVSSQAGWSIQGPTMPSDIAVDWNNTAGRTSYRVFVFLRGTGGLVVFTDDGVSVPTTASVGTVGVGSLASSASDVLSTGTKLTYDPKSDLLWGLAREARLIFSVDPATYEIVQKPTPSFFDGLWVLQSGTVFLIDRTNSTIYRGQ
jgi:hypothetical protein